MKPKMLLGLVTILPVIYCVFFVGWVCLGMISSSPPSHEFVAQIFVVHFVVFILNIGLLVFYLHHAYHNCALAPDQKTIWTILLLFGNVISMPIYWYEYVYRVNDLS